MSSPIDIPNAEQCCINHRLKRRIHHMEDQKKAKKLWSGHDRNYNRELNILAKAAGVQYYFTYKKHELALKLGLENRGVKSKI